VESPLAPHAASPQDLQERLTLEREGDPFLVYRVADRRQRLLRLEAGRERLSIGRRPEADISLTWDTEVSRLHALLERVGGEWTIVDDGMSQNGTWVSGERVHGRRRLSDGDVIQVGRTAVGFRNPAAGASGPTARGGDPADLVRISDAQRRVLVALCRPYRHSTAFATPATNQMIADELFLSVDAVKTHLKALFAKFELDAVPQNAKRAQLAERVMLLGLIGERDFAA
jgi:pSer/pThr/pTyr-binding forkhead associated (FHA) protein